MKIIIKFDLVTAPDLEPMGASMFSVYQIYCSILSIIVHWGFSRGKAPSLKLCHAEEMFGWSWSIALQEFILSVKCIFLMSIYKIETQKGVNDSLTNMIKNIYTSAMQDICKIHRFS